MTRIKSLDTFDFLAIPSLNNPLALELARCEFIERKENILALGKLGTGKRTALALGLPLARKDFGSGSPRRHRWRMNCCSRSSAAATNAAPRW